MDACFKETFLKPDTVSALISFVDEPDGDVGSIVVLSAKPGTDALDEYEEGSKRSPFAKVLFERLENSPNASWSKIFKDIPEAVHALTKGAQTPNVQYDLMPRGCLKPPCVDD